ncbi:endochitinase A-like, partial [Pecten maximus]|uniref:endochitinase A-like n=1 Tax=Pecten maximus TaxID=6579 RepID=UPI0014582CBB
MEKACNFMWIILLIYVPTICWTGRANILNVSKESQSDPSLIWLVQTAKHGTSDPSKRYAVLHSVSLGTGPTTNGGTLDSFVFGGTSDSYVEIENTDGELNGPDAMCWAFYVKFPAASSEAVLLQYFGRDGSKGFQLVLQTDGELRADFYDENGQVYTCTSSFGLNPDNWYLVGINFNTLWDSDEQFDIFYFETDSKVETESIGLSRSNPFLDTEGTVRLGAARDGTSPFNGEMSCVQFYNTSLIGKTQKSIYNLCDPNLMASDYGEHTMDFIATTTTPPTTTTTIQTTTTPPTTTTTLQTTTTTTPPTTTTTP